MVHFRFEFSTEEVNFIGTNFARGESGAGSKGATIRGIWAGIFDAAFLGYQSR